MYNNCLHAISPRITVIVIFLLAFAESRDYLSHVSFVQMDLSLITAIFETKILPNTMHFYFVIIL